MFRRAQGKPEVRGRQARASELSREPEFLGGGAGDDANGGDAGVTTSSAALVKPPVSNLLPLTSDLYPLTSFKGEIPL